MKDLYGFLKNSLAKELPGIEAQIKMAPQFAGTSYKHFKAPPDAKRSSVLLLLNNNSGSYEILFTLRSEKLKKHSGQISMPGGKNDLNESDIETALRETLEEVGIQKESINILGELSELYVPPSNSVIKPVVGYINYKPELIINEDEVEEAFWINIREFTDDKNLVWNKSIINGYEAYIPQWNIHKKTPLWGATAIILSEFLHIVGEYGLV